MFKSAVILFHLLLLHGFRRFFSFLSVNYLIVGLWDDRKLIIINEHMCKITIEENTFYSSVQLHAILHED